MSRLFFNELKLGVVAGVTLFGALLLTSPSRVSANGISDFEGSQCVATAMEEGVDVSKCADTSLPDCQIPDWFPDDAHNYAGIMTSMQSYHLSSSVRYNELIYDAAVSTSWADYRRYEHDWYSQSDTAYGPTLPSWGHLWNEYDHSGLIKSVSCDVHGTTVFP